MREGLGMLGDGNAVFQASLDGVKGVCLGRAGMAYNSAGRLQDILKGIWYCVE